MPFSDLKGYESITRVFQRIIEREAFHSAYLFTGPPLVGKRRLAHAFASAIFCQTRQGDFCGECSACRRMQSGTFPDYRVIEPDGAFIKIEQVRDMIGNATLQPHEAPKKIFVLDPAERMRVETANSLLKILEEPFAFSIFILITSSPRAILPTIESRCQRFRFSPLPYEYLAQQLMERHSLDRASAATLARISGGKPGLAEQLADKEFLKERDEIIETLTAIGHQRELAVLSFCQRFRSQRDKAERFLQLLIPILRDAALLRESAERKHLLNQDRHQEIATAARLFTSEELQNAWQDAVECTTNLRLNANPIVQIERVLLNLCPVEESLQR